MPFRAYSYVCSDRPVAAASRQSYPHECADVLEPRPRATRPSPRWRSIGRRPAPIRCSNCSARRAIAPSRSIVVQRKSATDTAPAKVPGLLALDPVVANYVGMEAVAR